MLLACVSLLASSISACACSHHAIQSVQKKKSCHSHAEEPATQEADKNSGSTHLNGSCVCFTREPLVASVKSERKATDLKSPLLVVEPESPSFERRSVAVRQPLIDRQFDQTYNSTARLGLLPARAPPRL